MTVGKIENGLERGFVKHRLNCLLITDPVSLFFTLCIIRLCRVNARRGEGRILELFLLNLSKDKLCS